MIMSQRTFIFSLIYAMSVSNAYPQSPKYNISDLEALEKEKNFQEFFTHAFDLRPSERQGLWKKIYQNMAILFLDEKIKSKHYTKEIHKQIEEFSKLSFLSKDEVFQFKRNKFNLNYLKNCYNTSVNKTICDFDLLNFWENSNQDPDIALDILEWNKSHISNIENWKFVEVIINDQVAPIYCKRESVINSIIKKINERSYDVNFNGNYGTLAKAMIPEKCLKELSPVFKSILVTNDSNGLEKEMAYSILDNRNEIDQKDKDFYLTLYLFSGPVVGEKMNLAWKTVEQLAESSIRRNAVLSKIQELDKIPDKLFYDPLNSRNKAIITHFSKNFPEILNFYATECMTLLKGKEDPKASSYFNCNQFFKTAQKLKDEKKELWLNDSVSQQYSATLK